MIIDFINKIALSIPIVWDRFTEEDNGECKEYDVYGWIERSDGKRDFVLLQLMVENDAMSCRYVTSSAKYSKTLCELIYGDSNDHIGCKKIKELAA